MRSPRAPFAGSLLLSALACAPGALAAPDKPSPRSSERATAADTLFQQGRALMASGRFDEACAKFAESERLDHGIGTLLNLADCQEQNGQLASAATTFRAAAAAASAEGQAEREHIAREREAALRPAVAKITVVLAGKVPAGLVVRRDDVVIGHELWGAGVPVDPGDHLVAISAPGKIAWFQTVRVPRQAGVRIAVAVPPLADGPSAADPAPGQDPRTGNAQRAAGVAVGSVGLGGLVAGAILGLRALSLNGASSLHCAADHCDRRGVDLRDDARGFGTASTVTFAIAGAAILGGVILYATAPAGRRAAVAWSLQPGRGAAVAIGGAW